MHLRRIHSTLSSTEQEIQRKLNLFLWTQLDWSNHTKLGMREDELIIGAVRNRGCRRDVDYHRHIDVLRPLNEEVFLDHLRVLCFKASLGNMMCLEDSVLQMMSDGRILRRTFGFAGAERELLEA
ncbi:hypothetical protein GW17_00049400 [Ensete ventricosum]|nr:hypothetical protein GW17_00049400 [Ensete ventricosum]